MGNVAPIVASYRLVASRVKLAWCEISHIKCVRMRTLARGTELAWRDDGGTWPSEFFRISLLLGCKLAWRDEGGTWPSGETSRVAWSVAWTRAPAERSNLVETPAHLSSNEILKN